MRIKVIHKASYVISGIVIGCLAFWFIFIGYLNNSFIPKVVIPKILRLIDSKCGSFLKLQIEKITFHPFKGFQIHGLSLSLKGKNEQTILRSKNIDVDIALRSIFKGLVIIEDLEIAGSEIYIRRDKEGKWNLQLLSQIDIFGKQKIEKSYFLIEGITVNQCKLNIKDIYQPDNQIYKQMYGIDIFLSKSGQDEYLLRLRKETALKEEKIVGNIQYIPKEKRVKGFIDLKTKILKTYWKYYLDELFESWRLDADESRIKAFFDLSHNRTDINGRAVFKKAELNNPEIKITGEKLLFDRFMYLKNTQGKGKGRIVLKLKNGHVDINQKIVLEKAQIKGSIDHRSVCLNQIVGEIDKTPVQANFEYFMTPEHKIKIAGFWGTLAIDISSFLEKTGNRKYLAAAKYKNSLIRASGNYREDKDCFERIETSGKIKISELKKEFGLGYRNGKGNLFFRAILQGDLNNIKTISGNLIVKINQRNNKSLNQSYKIIEGIIREGKIKGLIRGFFKRDAFYEAVLKPKTKISMFFCIHEFEKTIGLLRIKSDAAVRSEINFEDIKNIKFSLLPELFIDRAKIYLKEQKIINNGKAKAEFNKGVLKIRKSRFKILNINLEPKGFVDFKNRVMSIKDLKKAFQCGVKIMGHEPEIKRIEGVMQYKNSNFQLSAVFPEESKEEANFELKSRLDFKNLAEIFKKEMMYKLDGVISVDGKVRIPFKEIRESKADLSIQGEGISLFQITPLNLTGHINLEEGKLRGQIENQGYCDGTIDGSVYLDGERFGFEINLNDADIGKIFSHNEHLNTLKGQFSSNIALVNKHYKSNQWFGGGYLIVKRGYFWKAPLWASIKEGMDSVRGDFKYGNLEKIEGNFVIRKDQILLDRMYCESKNMNLDISGTVSFGGEINLNVNTNPIGRGILRSIRRLTNPIGTGINLLTKPLKIKIQGQWPKCSQKTTISSENLFSSWTPIRHRQKFKKYQLADLLNQ